MNTTLKFQQETIKIPIKIQSNQQCKVYILDITHQRC
jgi:hypothetical protein